MTSTNKNSDNISKSVLKIDDSPARNCDQVGKRKMQQKSETVRKLFASTTDTEEENM